MKITTVITFQSFCDINNRRDNFRYIVYENKLCYVNEMRILDWYQDVLMGVPVLITCVLVEMDLTVKFEFGC